MPLRPSFGLFPKLIGYGAGSEKNIERVQKYRGYINVTSYNLSVKNGPFWPKFTQIWPFRQAGKKLFVQNFEKKIFLIFLVRKSKKKEFEGKNPLFTLPTHA